MAKHVVAFIHALGLKQVDLLGFSLGGFVAQQVVLENTNVIRRVILAGTGPEGGEGMPSSDMNSRSTKRFGKRFKAACAPSPSPTSLSQNQTEKASASLTS
jgi:pimeloyl-ACP methyl ester carboxylesterase